VPRKEYLLGTSGAEVERQHKATREGSAYKYSARDARACLEAVSPHVPHMTARLWWVREAFLRHVKPEPRQPLPSVAAVVEYLGFPRKDVEVALAGLRTEGAWTASVRHKQRVVWRWNNGVLEVVPAKPLVRRKQPAPSRAEAVLNERAMQEAGHPQGTTLDSLTVEQLDALFPIVDKLRESCTRICQGCRVPMLDEAFDPQGKTCSVACRKRASRASQ